jgi:C4-dicarboxylate transporter DctM subunit
VLHRTEDGLCIAVLALMSGLPIVEVLTREWLGGGVPGSISIVQQMVMWLSFLGAALAARSDRLLALSTGKFLPTSWGRALGTATGLLAVAVTTLLAIASFDLVRVDWRFGNPAAWGIPAWAFTSIMPAMFGVIALRLIWHAAPTWRGRAIAALGCLLAVSFLMLPDAAYTKLLLPAGAALIAGTLLGMPIYAALGGAALILFAAEGTPISAVPGEAYRMTTSPMLPAIPLFTLAGYVLAEGGSSQRLLRLFSALVGWLPGGIAVVITLVLAFFTPLTGASGVTILAMGGLLLPMLRKSGSSERHSLGLITVSASIGVFFPPSLPVILYAYYADLDLNQMFVAGLVPGILLVTAIAAWGAWRGRAPDRSLSKFDIGELGRALWAAKWEVLLPIVVLGGIFGGFATLVEASALTVLYALVVECLLFKDLSMTRDVPRIVVQSATMIGGFMIILAVALGFTDYLVIAQVPARVLDWVSAWVQSPYTLLLALNLFLIVVGALMDIYSAIIVVVPLITPLAAAYGINPVHLGIVFLANMQLGYLMPPMGEDLFLSAYRFDRPLATVYRAVLPFMGIILGAVLLLTYVPALTLWLLGVWS